MVKISDLVILKNILKDAKIGKVSNEGLRAYLKLSLSVNKYATEFEEKRKALIEDAVKSKGYNVETITPEQDRELFTIIAPILDEYLNIEIDIETKVLSWNDLYDGFLNLEENRNLSIDDKTRLTQILCKDEL